MLTSSSSSSEILPWFLLSRWTPLLLEKGVGGVAVISGVWDDCDVCDSWDNDGSEEPVDDPDMVLLRAGRAPVSGSLVHTRFRLNSAYTWYVKKQRVELFFLGAFLRTSKEHI